MDKNHKKILQDVLSFAMPPPTLSGAEWAETYRFLSSESSAISGRWSNEQVPYLVDILNAATNPKVKEIIFQAGSQCAKSELILNVIGRAIHIDPSPILVVQPNDDLAEAFSKQRVAPMISDTPVLKSRVSEVKSRNSSNTIYSKSFPNGFLSIVTANSPTALAMRACRYALLDEVDRFPRSSGSEGDPIKLVTARQTTFEHNKKLIAVSTPLTQTTSRIVRLLKAPTSKKFLHVLQCEKCKEWFELSMAMLIIPDKEPKNAYFKCACGHTIREVDRIRMIKKSKWICLDPEKEDYRHGYELSGLHTLFRSTQTVVKNYLEDRLSTESLQVFTNTILGKPFEDRGEGSVEVSTLLMRKEQYKAEAPKGVLCITGAIDLGKGRADIEFIGWGEGRESWCLGYYKIFGEHESLDFWRRIEEFLHKKFTHELGFQMGVDGITIDSGFSTQEVYNFVHTVKCPRLYAIKGKSGTGRAIVSSPTHYRIGRDERGIRLFTVGVDEGKTFSYECLSILDPEKPGFCHFPNYESYNDSYFEALTCERVKISYRFGVPYKEWIRPKGRDNEPLDLRVYNLAALGILNPSWDGLKRRIEKMERLYKLGQKIEDFDDNNQGKNEEKEPRPKKVRKNGSSFVNSWKE